MKNLTNCGLVVDVFARNATQCAVCGARGSLPPQRIATLSPSGPGWPGGLLGCLLLVGGRRVMARGRVVTVVSSADKAEDVLCEWVGTWMNKLAGFQNPQFFECAEMP